MCKWAERVVPIAIASFVAGADYGVAFFIEQAKWGGSFGSHNVDFLALVAVPSDGGPDGGPWRLLLLRGRLPEASGEKVVG